MTTAVVGCGAVGCYYGAKICKTGEPVHVLVRSDWEAIAQNGIRVISDEGNVLAHPILALVPEEIGHVDLVLVALKTTANHRFKELVEPLVGPSTSIVTLQNGLGNESALAELFGKERVLGGLCFVCLNRIEPGVVHHFAFGKIVLGEYRRLPNERTHQIARLLRNAGLTVQVTDNLERARWEKLVWNIPFNGLGVAAAAGYDAFVEGQLPEAFNLWDTFATDQLLADPRWEAIVREVMNEVIAIARDQGLNISETFAEQQINLTKEMGHYRASTLVDFEAGKPLELDALFLQPLMAAQANGLETPRLATLCNFLLQMNAIASPAETAGEV
jgi:2-dehydropantoate 2-reductase